MENKTPTNKRKKIEKKVAKVDLKNFYKTNINTEPSNKKMSLKKKPLNKDKPGELEKNNILITQSDFKKENFKGNEIRKFENIYSPRTTFIIQHDNEETLLQDLRKSFDPISIKIFKSFYKERLGEIDKAEFIGLLQNNLLTWHPELKNRETIMMKLLAKIFEEIDIDNNRNVSWDELLEFVLHASTTIENKKNYEPKSFVPLKKIIDDSEYTDIVSHAFYIEKYNLIGIVVEGKSYILFYDAETCKKQKAFIDVKETQQKIDKMKLKELDEKAKEQIEKEEELKLIKLRNNLNLQKVKGVTTSINFDKNFKNKKLNLDIKSIRKRNETPEKIKDEINKLNSDYFTNNKKDFNKKLTILCTVFVDEYDILFVSSSNNKISAWKYDENEFKNINILEGESKDKFGITCAILDAELPQQTLEWDSIQKTLYSGQADGKILMWDIHKSKYLENSIFDFEVAKKEHEEDLKKNRIINVEGIEVKDDNYDDNTIRKYLTKITERSDKNSLVETLPERGKKIKLFGDNAYLSNKMDFCLDNVSVSCIKYIEKMQFLAAAYYNGILILWDTILKEHRKFYTDQRTGIYQIEYNSSKNLIYTCGFDHDIYIYDPYVDSRCIHKLKGHNYSINSIACINSDNDFISIDIYGNIKIWDLSNYYNYQSISLNETLNLMKYKSNFNQTKKKISSNQKMIYLPKVKKILTFGEKLMMFGMVATKLSDLCDTQIVLGSFYRPLKFHLYTICLKKIKIWNIFNGKLKYVFDSFLSSPKSEITAYFVDKAMKKIYVGESLGNVVCLNINTGKILKKYDSFKGEIISICHSQKLDILITLNSLSIIRLYKDKDFNENFMLKEFSVEDAAIKCLKLNEEYSRLILGASSGELIFFDIEHLKLETSFSTKKEELGKTRDEDPINEIYSFDEFPLVITFHESAINFFEITPPSYYKYRIFGKFVNYIKKDNKEIKVKITACEFDNKNSVLFTGDLFGNIQCFSLKNLLGNIRNLNLNENVEENNEYLENIEKFKMEKLFSFEASKEKIKHITYPKIKPSIIIVTGTDRRVKIFSSEKGEYIDEFKQSSENMREYPIGLKYYFSDPFVSKVTSDKELKCDTIYRKDIMNFKTSKLKKEIESMKSHHIPLDVYVNNIIRLFAKEKLYLLTKNSDLPYDKSSAWKYEPNIERINYGERKLSIVEIRNRIMFEYNPIDSTNYYPKFISYMSHEQLKDFSEAVNDKIRKVNLNLTKVEQNNSQIKNHENKEQPKNVMNYSYDKRKILKINNLKFPTISRKKNNIKDIFETYKNDFNSRINDLKYMFESTLYQKYMRLNEKKNKYNKSNRKYHLTIDNASGTKKPKNNKLLPYINKGKNY